MFLIRLASKNFIQIQVALILKKSLKMDQVFSLIYIKGFTNIQMKTEYLDLYYLT